MVNGYKDFERNFDFIFNVYEVILEGKHLCGVEE
jgi:hypothetical protein